MNDPSMIAQPHGPGIEPPEPAIEPRSEPPDRQERTIEKGVPPTGLDANGYMGALVAEEPQDTGGQAEHDIAEDP